MKLMKWIKFIKKYTTNIINNSIQFLILVTQILLCYFIYLQLAPIMKQNVLLEEQIDRQECQRMQDRYFQIYKHCQEDIDKLETPFYANILESKLKAEMKRMANNTIRHFSFEKDNPFLVVKVLESTLSYTYSEQEKLSGLGNEQKRFLASIDVQDKKRILKEVLELLRNDNSKWPTEEEYASWKSHQPCF